MNTLSRGGSRKFRKVGEGAESPTLSPNENFTFQEMHHTYSIVGVFVMHSKITLTFRKIQLKSIL